MKQATKYIVVLILFTVVFAWDNVSNSIDEIYTQNKQVTEIIAELSKSYGHEFKLLSKEIEHILYGKWLTGDTIGYSLKYDITGGSLNDAEIEILKNQLCIQYSEKTFRDPNLKLYKKIIFIYYQESLNSMKEDDYLDDYSGIEGLDHDTVGTIISVIGMPSDSADKYKTIPIKFIIINDKVIAVQKSTFYKLIKID